jgi:hypothetical protein
MERVETLFNKLKDQVSQQAPVDQLLVTVQMLQSELLHLKATQPESAKNVSIHIAPSYNQPATPAKEPVAEEKTVEVLQVDEAEVEAELEEIKRNAETRNHFGAHNKPPLLFDPVEDIPTLTHQQLPEEPAAKETPAAKKELHETIPTEQKDSLNDRLKQSKTELSDSLKDVPLKDLKKGIGVNDRFLFIRELFRGDETMYERSIKTINGFSILPEAEYWIRRELKLKLGWNDQNEVVKQFDQLIKRRFS